MIKLKQTNYSKSGKKPRTTKIALITFIIISALYFLFYRLTLFEKPDLQQKENILSKSALGNIDNIFWGQNILAKIAPLTECPDSVACRKFTNTNKTWFGMTEPVHSIDIGDEYLVKIRFKNENAKSGVNLVGSLSQEGKQWWEGRKSLNIYSNYGYLEINADTGKSEDPVSIYSQQIQTEENSFHTIYLTIKKNGEGIDIYDVSGSPIKNINLKTLFPKEFTIPIFPDNKFFLGISAEPNATLIIDEFYGMPLKTSGSDTEKISQKAVS